jgi:hypothetical protein
VRSDRYAPGPPRADAALATVDNPLANPAYSESLSHMFPEPDPLHPTLAGFILRSKI